jgi:hypothetical protein
LPPVLRLVLALFVFVLVAAPAQAAERCGTTTLYGKTLALYATGIPCSDVPQITAGACELDPEQTWGCFSGQGRSPVLVWFKTKEMFKDRWSVRIEARRPPCSQSVVTAAAWRGATGGTFPSEQQVLADDLIRCKQLRGLTKAQVRWLLGKPPETDPYAWYWQVGPERDSFIQVDSEYFTVEFDHRGRFRKASFSQG